MWGAQDIGPHAPLGGYIPVCQKLIISKYNHVTPHFKGNFMLNHNQVVKSSENHYFDCFNLFLGKSRNKYDGVSFTNCTTLNHSYKFSASIDRKR